MKQRKISWLRWLVPAILVLFGLFLENTIHGHGFLGWICYALAGVISVYFLIFSLEKRWKALRVLKWTLTVILCLGVAIFVVTEGLILRASIGNPEVACRYMIVLGAKVNGTEPSVSLTDRIQATYEYMCAHEDVVAILSGGQGEDEGITEAQCMFRELTEMGIEPNRLVLEEKATSTWENLKFSLEIIEKLEENGEMPKEIGIVSSEYHLYRASLLAREFGVETVGIPARTSLPTIALNYFLREVAGVWHYILLGGRYV